MTDQNHNESDNEWVRRAYADTPAPSPAAIDATVATIVAAVRDTTVVETRQRSSLRQWWRWTPVAAITAMCVAVLVWRESNQIDPTGNRVKAITQTYAAHPDSAPAAQSQLLPAPSGENATPSRTHTPAPLTVPSSQAPLATVTPAKGVDSLQSNVTAPPRTVTAAAPEPTLRERAVAGLDSVSAISVLSILDSATARGLPIEALVARVHEGVRRRVPAPRIVVVTRNFAAALADARTALGVPATVAEMQSGAEALLAGAPTTALQQLRAARPSGSIAEPLLALADLSTYGVAPLRASAALAALVAKGGSDAGVRTLRAGVIGDIIRGVPPDAALADHIPQIGSRDLQRPKAPTDGRTDSMPMRRGNP